MDSHPAYPMSCFLWFHFAGKLDRELFRQAANAVLQEHPLLRSIVAKDTSGRLHWVESGREPDIHFSDVDEIAAPQGLDLFCVPGLKMVILNGDTPEEFVLRLEVHHTATDAIGTLRFVEDLLFRYALARNFAAESTAREPVEPVRLRHRGAYGLSWGRFLRMLPRQVWGLERARTFLLHKIIPLVREKPDLSRPHPPPNYPALFSKEWDNECTRKIRSQAKRSDMTLNDLVLQTAFLALKEWQTQENIPPGKGFLRLAVPVNLRTPEDHLMPAANIVSMVFLDRKPGSIQNSSAFSHAIHREMEHIKHCNLGLALIFGLTVYRRLFGGFARMIGQDRCWTTATVSNLGTCFADSPFLKRNERLLIDRDLELVRIDTAPPIRPQSALGISLLSYAGRLTLNMQYDTTLLHADQARRFFDLLCDYLEESPAPNPLP